MQNKQKKMIPVQTSSLITVALLILFLLFLGIFSMKMLGMNLDICPSVVIFLIVLAASYLIVLYLIALLINSYVRLLCFIPVLTGITILSGIYFLSFDWNQTLFNPFVVTYSMVLYLLVALLQLFRETGGKNTELININSIKQLTALCTKWKNFRLLMALSSVMLFQAAYLLYVIRESPGSNAMEAAIGSVILFVFSAAAIFAIFIGMLIALRKVKKNLKAALLILFFPPIFVFFSLIYFFALISLSGHLAGL